MLDPRACVADNPFYVLELSPDCGRADVEREARKLLGMLELHLGQAATYPTPLGPQPRTTDKVRVAMAQLVDPQQRLMFEIWARIPSNATLETPDLADDPGASGGPYIATSAALGTPTAVANIDFEAARPAPPAGWSGARRALGWGP